MKRKYLFSTLRFTYDPLTQEFVNVGVVIFIPDERVLLARCAQQYSRVSKVFGLGVDGPRLRRTLRFIQDKINALGENLQNSLNFEKSHSLPALLASILPVDDSALQFHAGGAGLSENIDATLGKLFYDYVDRYNVSPSETKREDEDVWKTFKGEFERTQVLSRLQSKCIAAPNFEYEFQHSWKNGLWNCLEPLSFDLASPDSIADKANRWVGRATGLQDSADDFKLYLLMGKPLEPSLQLAYEKAENLLHKMPVKHEFISETEAAEFAISFADEVKTHDSETST